MATPAYYRNGVPYGADGRVIITITGGPVGPGSIAGTKTERPVYVGWPGMESAMSHGIGPVTHYDPHKSGHYSLESIREGQAQINELIIKAKNAHHYDDEKIVHDSMSLLESLNKSGLIHHAVLQAAAAVLQEAITALQENRLLRNKAGQDVNISTQAAVTAFEQFVQRDDVKMQNFRDARPFVFDFVLSISPVYRHIITLWNTLYLPKIQQEMEEKNNLVTYLDRVKIICTDIINKTESLNNEKVRIENAEQALKAQEERKTRPVTINDVKNPVIETAIKPLAPEPVLTDPIVIEPVVIEPPLSPFLTFNADLALKKPTALIPLVPIKSPPIRPLPLSPFLAAKIEGDDEKEMGEILSAIKFTSDFYKELTEKWGEKSAEIAQELAWEAKGRQIRNADEALEAFEKYKNVLNKKFSTKDQEAIGKALESLSQDEMTKNFARFSKGFGLIGSGIDAYETAIELKKAMDTNNWRPFYVKLETLAAGKVATFLTAFAYSIILGTPMGILGFALIMTLVGFFVNDKFVEKINRKLGI